MIKKSITPIMVVAYKNTNSNLRDGKFEVSELCYKSSHFFVYVNKDKRDLQNEQDNSLGISLSKDTKSVGYFKNEIKNEYVISISQNEYKNWEFDIKILGIPNKKIGRSRNTGSLIELKSNKDTQLFIVVESDSIRINI